MKPHEYIKDFERKFANKIAKNEWTECEQFLIGVLMDLDENFQANKFDVSSEEKIDRFVGKYRFLSNFHPSKVELDSVIYPTVEHAYQASKTLSFSERAYIREASTAKEARKRGRKSTIRADWEQVKLEVMWQLLKQKFNDPELATLLRETGNTVLIEGNWWGDTFWGVCNGIGTNHLGKLLMEVRELIK